MTHGDLRLGANIGVTTFQSQILSVKLKISLHACYGSKNGTILGLDTLKEKSPQTCHNFSEQRINYTWVTFIHPPANAKA